MYTKQATAKLFIFFIWIFTIRLEMINDSEFMFEM